METLPLSLRELLTLIHNDDESLYHNRVWLTLYTYASGHSQVISEQAAIAFSAADPAEQLIHIETYERAGYTLPAQIINSRHLPESYRAEKVHPKIHTLWRVDAWRESNEKARLCKLRSSKVLDGMLARHRCEWLAKDFATRLFGAQEPARLLANSLINEAGLYDKYDVLAFINRLRALAAQLPGLANKSFLDDYVKEFAPTTTVSQNA